MTKAIDAAFWCREAVPLLDEFGTKVEQEAEQVLKPFDQCY